MSRQFKISVGVLVAIFLILIGGDYVFQRWCDWKMVKVRQGLAAPAFPWRDYSQTELDKMYPQIKYADVATRVTPEQTYANFRQALKENNLQMAIEQLSKDSKNYKDNKSVLEKAYSEKKLSAIYKNYPEKISKSMLGESIAQYYFLKLEEGHNLRQYLEFIKDANGDWKMDNL